MSTITYDIQRIEQGTATANLQNLPEAVRTVELSTTFNPDTDYFSLDIYDQTSDVLLSRKEAIKTYSLTNYTVKGGEGVYKTALLNPYKDIQELDQQIDDVVLAYTHYKPVAEGIPDLTVKKISEDGLEFEIISIQLPSSILKLVESYDKAVKSSPEFPAIYMLGSQGTSALVLNIKPYKEGVAVKVQKPFSTPVQQFSQVQIIETLSDQIKYKVTVNIKQAQPQARKVRQPNFNKQEIQEVSTTDYLAIEDIVTSENQSIGQIATVKVNPDYSDPATYIKYSSGVRRLLNFNYKVQQLENLQSSIQDIQNITSGSEHSVQSLQVLETRVKNILNAFDHYEEHLYYESGSTSWPKSTSSKPYQLYTNSSIQVQTWITGALQSLEAYDNGNSSRLINTLPGYLIDHSTSEEFIKFIDMIGQHYDSLWIYSKAFNSRFDTDNRVDVGIPQELVKEALATFGYNIYPGQTTYSDTLESSYITGSFYPQGEVVTNIVTGSNYTDNTSIETLSGDRYAKEIYKRIFHNIPTLLKTRGTYRHLEVLYNCFGIPVNVLNAKTTSARDSENLNYISPVETVDYRDLGIQSNIQEIEGTVLSELTTIQNTNKQVQSRIRYVQLGISTADDIDSYIAANLTGSFDIDSYLGEEITGREEGYRELKHIRQALLNGITRFDIKDYSRLLRFWNSEMFRITAEHLSVNEVPLTGFIVKSDNLKYSPQKSIEGHFDNLTQEVLLDVIDIEGSSAIGILDPLEAAYSTVAQTPTGLATHNRNNHGEALYTGIFKSGSVSAADRELTRDNIWAKTNASLERFDKGDYNVSYGNIQQSRPSRYTTEEDQIATYQDSNDSLETWILGRYEGSKTDEDRFGNIEPSAGGIVFEAYAYPQNSFTGNPNETLKTVTSIKNAVIQEKEWQPYMLTNTGVLDFENLTGKQSAQVRSRVLAYNDANPALNKANDLTSYVFDLQYSNPNLETAPTGPGSGPTYMWIVNPTYIGTFNSNTVEIFAVIPYTQGLPKGIETFSKSKRWKLVDDEGRYETVSIIKVIQDFRLPDDFDNSKEGYLVNQDIDGGVPTPTTYSNIWPFEFYRITLQRPQARILGTSSNLVRLESIDSRVYSLDSSRLRIPARTYLKIKNTNQVVEVDEFGTAQLLPDA